MAMPAQSSIRKQRRYPYIGVLLALFLLSAGCAPLTPRAPAQPAHTPTPALVSIREVEANPDAFRDRPVRMRGHGITVATLPLCPGYVGLDRRSTFVDAAGARITANVRWKPAENVRMYDPDHVRVFTGFIRIFQGEIGCPGATRVETFPYFEITGVE